MNHPISPTVVSNPGTWSSTHPSLALLPRRHTGFFRAAPASRLLPWRPFCIGSTTWAGYHEFLGGLCKKTHCVAVSIDYRLPAPYEDCLDSIRWLSRNADSEPWLRRADLSRVFLSGDASGGNIVHHVMAEMKRRGAAAPRNVEIRRLLAMDPYFGSERRTESEAAEGAVAVVKLSNMLWGLSLPARPTVTISHATSTRKRRHCLKQWSGAIFRRWWFLQLGWMC